MQRVPGGGIAVPKADGVVAVPENNTTANDELDMSEHLAPAPLASASKLMKADESEMNIDLGSDFAVELGFDSDMFSEFTEESNNQDEDMAGNTDDNNDGAGGTSGTGNAKKKKTKKKGKKKK
jgi:hypothetical protein